MRRRFLLTAGALAAAPPVVASAQGGKVFRVGILTGGQREPFWSIFRNTLKDLGYVEGTNIKFEYRSSEYEPARLDALAAELVGLNVDVLVAVQTPAALAAKKATRTIPVLLAGVGDAVATGLVTSLARPEANLTGVSTATAELAGKSVELLKEILPAARRIAAIANAPDAFHKPFLEQLERAGSQGGIAIERVMIEREADLEPAFARLGGGAVDAVIVQPSLSVALAASLALKHRLPSAAASRRFVDAGGLLAYAADIRHLYRDSAIYLDKILKGAKPGDLPVQGPIQIELVINLKTAKALGVAVPQSILIRADEVIE
ncbi:MAG: ABC transporter substrate-binding protein [Reyranella sp.]|nr:ABC transporter substrate-binding protein [Reyranella sp.]